jgi:hypothetical protein
MEFFFGKKQEESGRRWWLMQAMHGFWRICSAKMEKTNRGLLIGKRKKMLFAAAKTAKTKCQTLQAK